MNLDPKDIKDEKVREWYNRKQPAKTDKIHWIHVDNLYSRKLLSCLQNGYKTYLEYLTEASLSHRNIAYKKYNSEELTQCAKNRMDLIESMKTHGYNNQFPIELKQYKYTKPITTLDRDGTKVTYSTFNGNHRAAIAKMLNIDYIPCVKTDFKKRPLQYLMNLATQKKWNWYQPFDFLNHKDANKDTHGINKYQHILKRNLDPIKDGTFLDIGCNTGLVTSCIAKDEAKLAIGIDYPWMIKRTWAVEETLWIDYGNLMFHPLNVMDVDEFDKFTSNYYFDGILMSNVVYYFGDKTDDILSICSKNSNKIILQGNHPKTPAFTQKNKNYIQENCSIEGMKKLLKKHNLTVSVDAPKGYSKPVVTGSCSKPILYSYLEPKAETTKSILSNLAKNSRYFSIAENRLLLSLEDVKKYAKGKILDIGGNETFKELFDSCFGNKIEYHFLNDQNIDARCDKLPFSDNTFDLVVCWETIEHLWNVRKTDTVLNWEGVIHFWKEAHRILKKGHPMHLTTTNRFCPRTLRFFNSISIPQISGSNLCDNKKGTSWGHSREFSGQELLDLADSTQCFTNNALKSVHCYDETTKPKTDIYDKWLKKFEQLVERPALQIELYDTLFFLGYKN